VPGTTYQANSVLETFSVEVSLAGIEPVAQWLRRSFFLCPGFTFPNQGIGDGRHQNYGDQNAPADGRRHAPMYVTEQLPDGRRQLPVEPEVSFSDMCQFADMRWNERSMSCVLWTSLKSSVAVTSG
jgi:hypothetical protein